MLPHGEDGFAGVGESIPPLRDIRELARGLQPPLLEERAQKSDIDWKGRDRENMEKMKTGRLEDVAVAGRQRGRGLSRPVRSWITWSGIPPTALATTARRFHSASETVSANPSRSDFCTTTAERLAAAATTTHERGIVLECTGRLAGKHVFTSLYENDAFVNVIQVVVGDAGTGASREVEQGFLGVGVQPAGHQGGRHPVTGRPGCPPGTGASGSYGVRV